MEHLVWLIKVIIKYDLTDNKKARNKGRSEQSRKIKGITILDMKYFPEVTEAISWPLTRMEDNKTRMIPDSADFS